MKKQYLIIALAAVGFVAPLYSASNIVSVNKSVLFTQSKEGKAFLAMYEKKKLAAEDALKKRDLEIRKEGERFQQQASLNMLSQDAIRKAQKSLAMKMKSLQREKEDQEELLKMEFEEGYAALRQKQQSTIDVVFKERGGEVLFDVNTPGVLAVAPQTDITAEVLKRIDNTFDGDKKKRA